MSEENGNKPQIFGLMAKILSEIGAIAKTRQNQQQGYAFRGIDDMYNALHPLFAEHGVFNTPRVLHKGVSERVTNSGSTLRFVELTVAYDFFASDGSSVTVETVGEAMDAGDKASNKAMSAAHKYALIQAFCIPTGEAPDADFTTQPESRPAGQQTPRTEAKADVPPCPECGGAMWDNRATKKGRQPDFSCKNKADCGKGIWLEDEAGKLTPQEAAISLLMQQAEKLLPPTSKKLAQLRGITDPNELGKKVQILVDLAKKKDADLRKKAGDDPEEKERLALIERILAAWPMEAVEKELNGRDINGLTLDALIELESSIVPF